MKKAKGTMEEKKQKKEDTKVSELQKRIGELEEQLKRAVADYRNLENRVEEEKRKTISFASKDLVSRLLPALDSLFLAGKHTTDQGVQLTVKRVLDVLESEGIEKIETKDVQFNPELMECVEVVEGNKENTVIEEIAPGFTMNGTLLRAAQVKVKN